MSPMDVSRCAHEACVSEQVTSQWKKKKSQGKIPPPHQLTRLPPHPQARSKGTATNLPEKEFLPFFSMFLNEALTLLCFHRPAKIHKC